MINGQAVKPENNRLCFDGIALGGDSTAAAAAVEKDTDGVPVAWQLFKVGDNLLTRNGEQINLVLSADDMQQMQNYFTEKGVKIPVDSRHYLWHLAQKLGVDESEVVKSLPDGRGTLAFGDIAARADGVWLENADYKPLPRKLMQEGVWRYFSPVIRGLSDGRLRITSVALENEPSINNLDAIAASAEDADINLTAGEPRKETTMKKLLATLAGLLGMDTIALAADGDADDSIITKMNNLKTTMDSSAAFTRKLCDSLTLGAEAQPDTILASVQGLIAKGKAGDSALVRIDALELAAENDKRDKLIEDGRTAGKLADSQLDWARGLDCAALSAYLDKAPAVVPVGNTNRQDIGGDATRAAAYKQGVESGNLRSVVANAPLLN